MLLTDATYLDFEGKSTTFAVDYFFDGSHFCWRWGGTSPRPGIIGLIGVIPVIMLRPGFKPGTQIGVCKVHKISFWLVDLRSISVVTLLFST